MKCTDHIPDDKGDDEFFQRFGYYSSILGRPCQNEAVIFLQDDDGRNEYGQFDEALCYACAQRLIDRIRDDARLAKLARDVTLRLDQHRLRSAFMAELRSRLNNAVRLAALGDVGLYDVMDAMSQRAFGDFAVTDKKGEHYIRHSWANWMSTQSACLKRCYAASRSAGKSTRRRSSACSTSHWRRPKDALSGLTDIISTT